MNIRLKTSFEMETLLVQLQTNLQFSTKAAVMRLAIGFSLQKKGDPRIVGDSEYKYDIKNQSGQDYLRLTILGNDDMLYKLIMEEHLGHSISDDDFFPSLVYSHIDRGIKILDSEYKYAKNKDDFFKVILKMKEI